MIASRTKHSIQMLGGFELGWCSGVVDQVDRRGLFEYGRDDLLKPFCA